MATAQEAHRPHLDGWHFGDTFKIGTGGHGDTLETYTETYAKELSFLKGFTTLTYDTGNTEIIKGRSKPIHYKSKFNELRATTIYDVIKISPLIGKEFTSCGFANNNKITCYDLIKYDGDSKIKVGISFVSGDYEARLIKGKSALLYKQKITRTFKGKK
tara:strand:- start:40 stop:516 length:477 start_codon:yes stop_codon:yes gene_type:complete